MHRTAKRYFFLPGLFLLLLGVGNIGVGVLRRQEWDEVLAKLQGISSGEASQNDFQNSDETKADLFADRTARKDRERLELRQQSAAAKRQLYAIVELGGKIFVGIGALLLLAGFIIQSRTIN